VIQQIENAEIVTFETEQEWLAARKHGITATDMASIMGVNEYKSAYRLWLEKRGDILPDDLSGNLAIRCGHALQSEVARQYEIETDRMVIAPPADFWIVRSKRNPLFIVSPDYQVRAADKSGMGALECKAVGERQAENWRDTAPLAYRIQLQWQMCVESFSWGSLAAIIGNRDFRFLDDDADQELADIMMTHAEDFWKSLSAGIEPIVDDSESTKRALYERFRSEKTETLIDVDESFLEYDRLRTECKASMDEMKKTLDGVENQIKAAIGDATGIRLPNGAIYTWKSESKKEYTVKAQTNRVLRKPKGV
jgi:putative phage-type endonuclease